MSRVGKKPIELPKGVSVALKKDNKDNLIEVKGPRGTLSRVLHSDITVNQENDTLVFERPSEEKKHKALHGTTRAIVNNMVVGVTEGYKIVLELVGVGYKAELIGKSVLNLDLGYSHTILFEVPTEITPSVFVKKGQSPTITLDSNNKELIGQVAAALKKLRPVEPYKGKGVRFVGEVVRKKLGKAGAKK